ncbi:MAG: hypothetical protein QXU81_00165 [Candidatus Bathyarchaeia archaeon]
MSYIKRRSPGYIPPKKIRMRSVSMPSGFGKERDRESMRVAGLTSFMARFLSGKQNVSVRFEDMGFFAAGHDVTKRGDEIYKISLPRFETYDLPVKGFDKFRIYNCGLWHEACHVRYTPPALFRYASDSPLRHYLFNIFEDRRIEELGVEQWPGFLPERLYQQAYAYALRPSVDEIQDPNQRKLEALLQRYLIGKIKGKLPTDELEKVEKCNELFEKKLNEMKEKKMLPSKMAAEINQLIEEAIKILQIDRYTVVSPPLWEDTFTEQHARRREKDKREKGEDFEGSVKKDIEDFFKDIEKKARTLKDGEEKREPTEITDRDVEAARKGTAEVQSQYREILRGASVIDEDADPVDTHFLPVPSRGPVSLYKDPQFMATLSTRLRDWKAGFKKIVGESGASFSVREYLRSKGKAPFETRIKKSVHGKKVLIIADFSSSMRPREEDYKRAIVSAAEAIDSIGANVALFTFAGDPSYGEGFYKVKTFEEKQWRNDHSSRVAALQADYWCTPLDTFYSQLLSYVKKHRPLVTITVTDGEPDRTETARTQIRELKKYTRMVAFGLPEEGKTERMREKLRELGYHSYVVVENLHELPAKLVKTIAPE